MPLKGLKGGAGVKPLGYGLGVSEAEETDANFNQTVLLLHADGSEGAGNTSALGSPNYKAFRDNSTSAHAITVQGDAYGNDFSPYYYANGYWSNLFRGTTADYLILPSSSDFDLDTGNFTIEFWAFITNDITSDTQNQMAISASYTTGRYINFRDGATYGRVQVTVGGGDHNINLTSNPKGAWHHFAIVRTNSTTIELFYDGVSMGTATVSGDFDLSNGGASVTHIGAWYNAGYPFYGYLSNFRIIKGTALYTSNFTPSTSPFTTTSQSATSSEVKLLTCQSNRFLDNSNSSHSITVGNAPKVSTNTPFTQSKTANVGSGFFDGTGDELEITNSSDFAFGTGDFQISVWVYLLENSGGLVGLTGGTATGYWCLTANGGTLYFQDAHNAHDLFNTTLPSLHAWHFIEVSRVSSTTKMFIDGVQTNTTSDTTNYNQTGQTLDIGDHGNHGEPKGYIADVRIIKGSGVTSSTLPTTSLTSTGSETKLLTCQYSGAVRNVGFVDDSKYNHQITRNGNVHMGTFSPFSVKDGYWSVYFNTTYYTIPDSSDFTFGSNNFSIAVWVYRTGTNASTEAAIANTGGNSYTSWLFTTKKFWATVNGSSWGIQIDYSQDVPLNQWVYVQVNRVGNVYTAYQNGVSVGTTTVSGSLYNNSSNFELGYRNGAGTMLGYMSNFIIINGGNLPSTNVPTSPATAISYTKLLCLQSSNWGDNSSSGHVLTPNDTTKVFVLPFSPFAPSRSYSKDAVGGSYYFDGTGDYLQLTDTNFGDFDFGTGPFLIEGWIYYTTLGNTILGQTDWGNVLQRNTSSQLEFYQANASGDGGTMWITGTTTLYAYQWYHFALQRDNSGTLDLWINGSRDATDTGHTSDTMKFHSAKGDITVAFWHTAASSNVNYISNLRIKNSAVYTSGATITVPTAPFTADANTVLLLSGNNAGIIDHTMKNNFETVGNTRIRTDIKKYGTGSIYFDGTGDVLVQKAGRLTFYFGYEQFTFEFWCQIPSDAADTSLQMFMSSEGGSWSDGAISYYTAYSSGAGNHKFPFYVHDYHNALPMLNAVDDLRDGNWHHHAIVRGTSGACAYFVDGTRKTTATHTGIVGSPTRDMKFGGIDTSSRNSEFFLDDLRVTIGVARYDPSQSSVTIPTEPFANR